MQRKAFARSAASPAIRSPAQAPTTSARPGSANLQFFRQDADVDLDLAVHDADRVSVHREHRGERLHLAGREVKTCAVARALDEAILELALAEHAAVVRADVVDRAPGAVVAVAEAEAPAVRLDDLHVARRDVGLVRDGDELAQAAASSSATRPMRGSSAASTFARTCGSGIAATTRLKKPRTRSCSASSRGIPRDIT